MFALAHLLFCVAFSKATAPRAVARSRARSPWLSVSFWELFLCAYFVKEKVDKR
jgi:hypothetical protein